MCGEVRWVVNDGCCEERGLGDEGEGEVSEKSKWKGCG